MDEHAEYLFCHYNRDIENVPVRTIAFIAVIEPDSLLYTTQFYFILCKILMTFFLYIFCELQAARS
jgi:hypothetical protein